jgi:hypothetical protein
MITNIFCTNIWEYQKGTVYFMREMLRGEEVAASLLASSSYIYCFSSLPFSPLFYKA